MKFYLKTLPLVLVFVSIGAILKFWLHISLSSEILEIYYAVFGTLYAIVIGFVLFAVISNYDEINKQINLEVNSLQDLRDFLRYIDYDQTSVQLTQQRIREYTESVIQVEWKKLIQGDQVDTDTSQELYGIIDAVNKIKLDGEDVNDQIAIEMLIKTLGELTTYRTNRLNSVREHIPEVLIHLLFFLSSCIVIPLALLPMPHTLWWLIINSVAAFTIVFLFNIIRDLGNHFSGYWSISDKAFKQFLSKVDESITKGETS